MEAQQLQLSGRACETCRLRRVKCDKQLPGCKRCEKLGQPCSGYKTERRFYDDGAKVRRKFNQDTTSAGDLRITPPAKAQHSPVVSPRATSSTQAPAGAFFNTILGHNGQVVPAPSILSKQQPSDRRSPARGNSGQRFSTGTNNGAFTFDQAAAGHVAGVPTPTSQYPLTAQLLGNFNSFDSKNIASAPSPDEDFFDLDIESYYASGNNACGFIPGLPVILSDINDIDPNETESVGESIALPPSVRRSTQRRIGKAEADDRGRETAELLRHFVELMAPWMDVLDIDGYFSRVMPLKATDNVMLRSALAAVAAKQIASVCEDKHEKGLPGSRALSSHSLLDQKSTDWFYKAASYYDKAISHLRIHLQRLAQAPAQHQSTVAGATSEKHNDWNGPHSGNADSHRALKRRRAPPANTRDAEIDDLLSAISVFSLYDSLDKGNAGLSQHLNGMQSLLEDKFRSRRLSDPLTTPSNIRTDKAATAAFWNFAREDLLIAHASHQTTRLDPTDLVLWNAAGLSISPEDFTAPIASPLLERLADEGDHAGREDTFVSALIWILLRVVNFVNTEPTATISDAYGTPTSSNSPGSMEVSPTQHHQWQNLRHLMDGWYEILPLTFDPYASLDYDSEQGESDTAIKKLLYSLPLAAAATSLYHFGQILLILNQLMQAERVRTPASRLRFLRTMTDESQSHARQICGIALGDPPAAVWRQLVYPLHLAGQCFDEEKDRKLVLKLLESIATETDCSTSLLMQELRAEWGWAHADT